ncbi:MAG: DUF1641 domain-containing protein [Candidatus Asgardarchaeia archaeon]
MSGEEIFEKIDGETIDTIEELVHTTRLLQSFLNDQVVADFSKLITPLLRLLNAVASSDIVDVLERAMQYPEVDRALIDPPKIGGLFGLLGAMKDDDVKRGLGIAFTLLKALGKAARELKEINEQQEKLKKMPH